MTDCQTCAFCGGPIGASPIGDYCSKGCAYNQQELTRLTEKKEKRREAHRKAWMAIAGIKKPA